MSGPSLKDTQAPKTGKPGGGTIVTRRKSGEAFTIVRKSLGEDSSLSWQARGVMLYLLGKPDGWRVQITDLVNQSPAGERYVRVILQELRGRGYALLERISGDRGRFTEWRWTVSDEPEFSPLCVRPHVVKSDISKKEPNKTDFPNLILLAADPDEPHPPSCWCLEKCRKAKS